MIKLISHSHWKNSEGVMSTVKHWNVTHIPGVTEPKQSTVEVYAAKIEPKFASTLIRKLNSCAPLSNLSHLKRVRKENYNSGFQLSIILCLAHNDDRCSLEKMPPEVFDIVAEYGLQPFVITVSQHAACSREEWEEQCKLWPTSYHPNANLNGVITRFEINELENIYKFMRAAIKQSKIAASAFQPANGAVIVNPAVERVVAVGHDETGGWMDGTCGHSNYEHVALRQDGCAVQDVHVGTRPWHPLRHAVMVAIERVAEISVSEENLMLQSDCNRLSSKRLRKDEGNDSSKEKSCHDNQQYLCTGFDVYVTREPCSMCAMALLHQRFQRVFYGISNPIVGALGGSHKLHRERGLNHHYLVFKVSLSEEDLQ